MSNNLPSTRLLWRVYFDWLTGVMAMWIHYAHLTERGWYHGLNIRGHWMEFVWKGRRGFAWMANCDGGWPIPLDVNNDYYYKPLLQPRCKLLGAVQGVIVRGPCSILTPFLEVPYEALVGNVGLPYSFWYTDPWYQFPEISPDLLA